MPKIYISGKIGGLEPNVFIEKFNKKKEELQNIGYDVVSPVDLSHNHDHKWQSYMIEDLIALCDCTEIYMLNCWTQSPGAKIEHDFAVRMGIKIHYENAAI
jgi:hypothetical protein